MYCRYIGISTQRLGQTATKSDIRQNQSFIQSKFENQAGGQSGRRHKIKQNSLESFGDQRQNSGQTLKEKSLESSRITTRQSGADYDLEH